jgi:hypothetical protein
MWPAIGQPLPYVESARALDGRGDSCDDDNFAFNAYSSLRFPRGGPGEVAVQGTGDV